MCLSPVLLLLLLLLLLLPLLLLMLTTPLLLGILFTTGPPSLGLDKVILCALSDLFHQAGQAIFVGLLDLKAPVTREGTIDYQG